MEIDFIVDAKQRQLVVIHTIENHKRFGNFNLDTKQIEHCGKIYESLYDFIACHYMKYPYLICDKDKWL